MHTLLGLLAFVTVAFGARPDDIYPIYVEPEHEAVAWTVVLNDAAPRCTARAWIGRMGEHAIINLFAVEVDGTVSSREDGETPLHGLAPSTYDLHYEGDG